MSKRSDLVKAIVKKPAPKSSYGTDPNDPWSARSNIDEGITSFHADILHRYLKSKGWNPKYITKDQKDAHAKTLEFQKWKRDHGIYEELASISPKQIRSHTTDSPTIKRKQQLSKASSIGTVTTLPPPSTRGLKNEDTMDPKAAVAAPGVVEKTERMGKIVKSAAKKLKEGLYDWEKESKEKQFLKKPTLSKTGSDNTPSDSEKATGDARMVLKGGTTMTGQKRDTVEIDPMLKNRGKFPDYVDTTKQKN
jgi:hypothetical protein